MSEEDQTTQEPGYPTDEGVHPWLGVPVDFVEPLGALAVAAGRVEMMAAITYRAFLFPLDVEARSELLRRKQFSTILRDVQALMDTAIVAEVDESLPGDWKHWAKYSGQFMAKRNTWLHSTWARSVNGWVPISVGRAGAPETVHSSQIEFAAREGMIFARQCEAIASRVHKVVTSQAYAQRQATQGRNMPDGVSPI